jgi:DNA transformation protein
MSADTALTAWLDEALAPMGAVSVRKMFGGAGVYLDGAIFAILAEGELWLKSDADADPRFDAAGCERFVVDYGEGKRGTMNYRRAPGDIYDDAEALQDWTRLALAASQRSAKPRRTRG